MSALGQTLTPRSEPECLRPPGVHDAASALGSYVPRPAGADAAIELLFDHFVGAREQRDRHVQSERLGGLEVDEQLELVGELHREIGRRFAFQHAVDIPCRAPVEVKIVHAVGRKPASRDVETKRENARQSMARCQRDDEVAVGRHERARQQYQAAVWLCYECLDGALDAFCVARRMGLDLDSEGWRSRFNRRDVSGRSRLLGIVKDRDASDVWSNLLEQFQPFQGDGVLEEGKAGYVAARPRQAFNQAKADRIGHLGKHHRDGPGLPMQWHAADVGAPKITSGFSATSSAA